MYGGILLPVDGSECADSAAENAIDLARTYDAALHVLYVVDVRLGYADSLADRPTVESDADSGSPDAGDADRWSEAVKTRGEAVVDDVAERARAAGVDVVPAIKIGDPESVIVTYADDDAIDLVVMGTHGQSGLARLLLGSTTEYVLRRANVPVFTVRHATD